MLNTRRTWLITAAAAIFLVVVILFVWTSEQSALPEGFASANGRLEATSVDIATKRPGRLSEVAVREGDRVEKGQIVARMDVRDLEADLRLAQAEFEEAVQAKCAAEARLAQQESVVEFAAAEFERSRSLVNQQLIPQQEADLSRSKLQSEKAGLEAARATVSQANAAIAAAQAKVDSIQTDLDDSILTSPIAARVLYRLAEPGEVLSVGGKVLTLIDLNDVYMTAFLPTQHAGRLSLGSEARIVLDARPDVALLARISFVSPEAQFTPKEVETETEREKLMFRIKADIAPQLLSRHFDSIPTGVPGTLYVRLDPGAEWPGMLQPPSAINPN